MVLDRFKSFQALVGCWMMFCFFLVVKVFDKLGSATVLVTFGPQYTVGVLAEAHWGATDSQAGWHRKAERQPLCGCLECSFVDVIVFVLFSSMKSSSTILIDMFFILFKISSPFTACFADVFMSSQSASGHSHTLLGKNSVYWDTNLLVVMSANSFTFNMCGRFWAFVV